MSDLVIKVFKHNNPQPATTVTIPGTILKIASNLIPNSAKEKLSEEGIDVEELAILAKNPEARGRLVTVEDHEKNERVEIDLE